MEDLQLSDNIKLHSLFRDYQVHFLNRFELDMKSRLLDGDWLIVDENIEHLYHDKIHPSLSCHKHLLIHADETQKSFDKLGGIINSLIEGGFKKNNRLVAVGGGITQDIVAFISSILYRGVNWIFYPTTLLAQCDSCIGSKTSINFGKYKNQLGTFNPPSTIIIDTDFLDTLSDSAIHSGIGEMFHYFLVSGEDDYNIIKSLYASCKSNRKIMENLIRRSLSIKKVLAEKDEFDRGPRNIFNYGHSFGHALESVTAYRIPHGIAVSFGMDMANYVSVKMGYIEDSLRDDIRQLLSWNWNGVSIDSVDVNVFLNALAKDKKNVGNEVRLILTKGLGKMFRDTFELKGDIETWIKEWFSSNQS